MSAGEFQAFASANVPVVDMMGLRVDVIEIGRAAVRAPYRDDYLRLDSRPRHLYLLAATARAHVAIRRELTRRHARNGPSL